MVVLEVGLTAQAHHAQRRTDRPYAGSQDSTNEQNRGVFPDTSVKGHGEVAQYRYNGLWQVAHGSSLPGSRVRIKRTLPLTFCLLNG